MSRSYCTPKIIKTNDDVKDLKEKINSLTKENFASAQAVEDMVDDVIVNSTKIQNNITNISGIANILADAKCIKYMDSDWKVDSENMGNTIRYERFRAKVAFKIDGEQEDNDYTDIDIYLGNAKIFFKGTTGSNTVEINISKTLCTVLYMSASIRDLSSANPTSIDIMYNHSNLIYEHAVIQSGISSDIYWFMDGDLQVSAKRDARYYYTEENDVQRRKHYRDEQVGSDYAIVPFIIVTAVISDLEE